MIERRKCIRVTCKTKAKIESGSTKMMGTIYNLSEEGAYIAVPDATQFGVGQCLSFSFALAHKRKKVKLKGKAQIIWKDNECGLGLSFLPFSPQETTRVIEIVSFMRQSQAAS